MRISGRVHANILVGSFWGREIYKCVMYGIDIKVDVF